MSAARGSACFLGVLCTVLAANLSAALVIPSNTWVERPTPTQVLPAGRTGFYEGRGWNHLRYDAVAGKMVLYDGYVEPPDYPLGNIYANSLWFYDPITNVLSLEKLSHWTRVNGVTLPLPENDLDPTPFDRHSYACIAYSASKNSLYMWAGANNSIPTDYLGDTWVYEFANHAWRQILAPPPFTVFEQSISYDPYREKLLLSGGAPAGYGDGTKTYLFDLNAETWSDAAPSTLPPPRFSQASCFDPVRRVTWMFGGGPYEQGTDELWKYDVAGNEWSQVSPSGAWPSGRRFAHMAYDTKHNIILLWGGLTSSKEVLTDTWAFHPATETWNLLTPATAPTNPPRDNAEDMDYDPVNDWFVLNLGGTFWLYRYPGAAGPQGDSGSIQSFRILSSIPAANGATVGFTLARGARVTIDVIDLAGRRVAQVVDRGYPAGPNQVSWSGRAGGRRAPSGVYFLRLTSMGSSRTSRFVLLH